MHKYVILFCVGLLFGLPCNVAGQSDSQSVSYQLSDDYTFVISGTSNVRDWEVVTNKIRAKIVFGPEVVDWVNGATKRIGTVETGAFSGTQWIDEVHFSFPAKSLDSGISIMNETMYKHLLTDRHPLISYKLSEVRNIQEGDHAGTLELTVLGITRAAGEDHDVEHTVQLTRTDNGFVTVSGEIDMKMTDFNIDPPEFMRGALVTSDDIHLEFHFTLFSN